MAMSWTSGRVKMVIGIFIMSFCGFFLFASYSYGIKNRNTSINLPGFLDNHVKKQKMVSNHADAEYPSDENIHSEVESHLKTNVPNSLQYGRSKSTKPPVIDIVEERLDEKVPGEDKGMVTETKDVSKPNGRSDSKSLRKKSNHSPIQRSRAPKWFSADDIDKMLHLATWNISHLENIPHHPKVDKIIFDKHGNFEIQPTTNDHLSVCTDQCAVLKSYRDMFEVVAYHLDRVLGLDRALPAVARAFTGLGHLGLRYEDGRARPLIWWDPDLIHGGEFQEDQNSFELDWSTYQSILRARCWADGRKPRPWDRCSVVHLEWARLAMFDFLHFCRVPRRAVEVLKTGRLAELLLRSLQVDRVLD